MTLPYPNPESPDRATPASPLATWHAVSYLPALVVPPLFAYSMTPSPTLLNQLLSVFGWGLCLLSCAPGGPLLQRPRVLGALVAALLLMAASMVGSWSLGSLPTSLALPPFALIVATLAVAALGGRRAVEPPLSGPAPASLPPFEPFAIGVAAVGVLSGLVALIQVFAPQWTDAVFIAHSGLVGRAVGNLRQPNHLATLLLWGIVALVPLADDARRYPRLLLGALGLLMVVGVLLSASRTGLVGLGLLAVWGVLDRRLPRAVRVALFSVPLVVALGWYGLDQWAAHTQHVFGAESRLAEKDVSGSRFGIWGNTLQLIRQQPWLGVGWGEFNFAWTLTAFPGRPPAFFDHTHNLPLQLLVEMGVPLGTLVLALLLLALGQAGWRAWHADGPTGAGARAAWVMVALVCLHSLLEYPLWYAYFLLPAAWAWGFALGAAPAAALETHSPVVHAPRSATGLRWVGALLAAGAVAAAVDYFAVYQIFEPRDSSVSLPDRIARGQHSPLFAHHADYAAATTAEVPSRALGAFERATHALIDGRLMIAWANAFAESGDLDRARYVAARLREFDKAAAESFFAPCDDPQVSTKPFQCSPPSRPLTWRDFR